MASKHTAPKKISLSKLLNVNDELPWGECGDASDARCDPPGGAKRTDDVITEIMLRTRQRGS